MYSDAMNQMMSRRDAADMAGVSVRTIDRWRRERKLTTHRVRRFVLVDRTELEPLTETRTEER
jgi:excisionase family DNA binding protein